MPVMGQMIEVPNVNEHAPQKSPRAQRVGLFAALLCFALITSGLLVAFTVTRAQEQTHLGTSTTTHLKSTPLVQGTLPVPSKQVIFSTNPAAKVLKTVALSDHVNFQSGLPFKEKNSFTVGQTLYLSCIVNPPKNGRLNVKWFINGNLYQQTPTSITTTSGASQTAIISIAFYQASEGKVQIYWNDELAATLLFVIEPKVAS